jgi:hypothetical protein
MCATLNLIGLGLDVVGASILLTRPAVKYLRPIFSPKVRYEIEEEAIDVAWPNWAPNNRGEQLADYRARGFITTYKTSFWGFVLLLIGFLLQLIGSL